MTPAGQSMLGEDRIGVILSYLDRSLKVDGEVWECGVYAGGTAHFMARYIAPDYPNRKRAVRLFDTFKGIALSDWTVDFHKDGEFGDVDAESVKALFAEYPFVSVHEGIFPETFKPFSESKICFAHVDCDVYASVKGCMDFIWPRLATGGVIISDDYFHPNCLGAKKAVDEFMAKEHDWTITPGVYPQLIIRKE